MGRSKKPRGGTHGDARQRMSVVGDKLRTKKGREEVAQAIVDESSMDATQAYLQRGRPYAALAIKELSETWLTGLRAFLNDPGNDRVHKDANAEFALRNLEPPYDDAKAEIEALVAKARSMVADARARDRISESIAATIEKWAKGNN